MISFWFGFFKSTKFYLFLYLPWGLQHPSDPDLEESDFISSLSLQYSNDTSSYFLGFKSKEEMVYIFLVFQQENVKGPKEAHHQSVLPRFLVSPGSRSPVAVEAMARTTQPWLLPCSWDAETTAYLFPSQSLGWNQSFCPTACTWLTYPEQYCSLCDNCKDLGVGWG